MSVSRHELPVIAVAFVFGLGFYERLRLSILADADRESLREVDSVLQDAADSAREGETFRHRCGHNGLMELEISRDADLSIHMSMSRDVACAVENALIAVRGWSAENEGPTIFNATLEEIFQIILGIRRLKAAIARNGRLKAGVSKSG